VNMEGREVRPSPTFPNGARQTKRAPIGEYPSQVWIVIPAHNEGPRIAAVLAELLPLWRNIVVIDDGSSDETAELASMEPVWLLRHGMNLGQGAAIQTGIEFALGRGGRYIVTFDADGQHDPADVGILISRLESGGLDFALGSRFLGTAKGIPLTRAITLRVGVLFTYALSGVRLTDVHNGLRAMTARGAAALQLEQNGMEHASEIIDQIRASGLPFAEVGVRVRYTPETLKKWQRSGAALGLALRLLLDRILR
jgi:polyprenyl-phospho-N-acetylgalactosaminyl synthase